MANKKETNIQPVDPFMVSGGLKMMEVHLKTFCIKDPINPQP